MSRHAAVQSWPALTNEYAANLGATFPTSMSSKTSAGALPPSSRWTPLESLGGRGGDFPPGARVASQGDHRDAGGLDYRRPGRGIAQDDVQDAFREDPSRDPGQLDCGVRGDLGRLEDDAVACGQRRPDLPHRFQQRIVPWGDEPDNSQRFPLGDRTEAGSVLATGYPVADACRAGVEAQHVAD